MASTGLKPATATPCQGDNIPAELRRNGGLKALLRPCINETL